MTAQQIIDEIKRSAPNEQLGVIRFAHQLDAERRLSGEELSKLAARMSETDDAVETGNNSRHDRARFLRRGVVVAAVSAASANQTPTDREVF
ncbi:MAG TPA: hypothetical protein VGI41_08375 [Candidatus Udaeobacter sp.]